MALKSSKGQEELEEARFAVGVLGGRIERVDTFDLPEDAGERQIVTIEKRSQTPKNIRVNRERQTNHHLLNKAWIMEY